MMSGTSADGVDAAWLEFDDQGVKARGPSHFEPYTQAEKRAILDNMGAWQASLATLDAIHAAHNVENGALFRLILGLGGAFGFSSLGGFLVFGSEAEASFGASVSGFGSLLFSGIETSASLYLAMKGFENAFDLKAFHAKHGRFGALGGGAVRR